MNRVFSDGRRLSGLSSSSSLESWDGWKWAASPGTSQTPDCGFMITQHMLSCVLNVWCSRSAAVSWLPASLLFVGNIYAGSRALSRIVRLLTFCIMNYRKGCHLAAYLLVWTVFLFVQDIPFFFTLQNSSHVVSYVVLKVVQREVRAPME